VKNYTYHFEIQSIVAQFMAALDDIIVKRYDKERTPSEEIKVRFLYSPKQRILQDLTDKAQNLQLPVVAVSLGSITRDSGRVYNKLLGSDYRDDRLFGKANHMPQPLPIDLTVNVDIIAKYTEDIDQITTNFVPYCDPYFVISWRIPEMNDYEIRSIVNWSGTMNITYPTDVGANTNWRVTGSTNFTIKGWLFKATSTTPLIFNITQTMYDLQQKYTTYDVQRIRGRPQPYACLPNTLKHNSESRDITLYGDMFREVTAVYLSGAPVAQSSLSFAPFLSSHNLSAEFSPFTAMPLNSTMYTVNSENRMTVTIPLSVDVGHIDFIIVNPAGYSTLVYNANLHNSEYTSPVPVVRGLHIF